MEELELLKKDWQRNQTPNLEFSEGDIYTMLHQKSSSVVKWILIVSILEFLVLRFLDIYFLFNKPLNDNLKKFHLNEFDSIMTVVNFVALVIFMYIFYKNYQKICAASNTKKLMQDIINTRRTVKYYVWYNLVFIFLTSVVTLFNLAQYSEKIHSLTQGKTSLFIALSTLVILVLLGLFMLFYRLLYGFLLKRLYRNYKELEKIDL